MTATSENAPTANDTEVNAGGLLPANALERILAMKPKLFINGRRSHMERGHLPPIQVVPEEVSKLNRDQIMVRSYVGGLVQSFERRAA